MANGFPTYRLKEQQLISLQFRLIGCVRDTRAEPYPYGSDEYLDLELYLAHRAQGLPVEAPSVRR
jgi:sulfur-oxidizing protein SoxA